MPAAGPKSFLDGVERAGAYVAVHHTQCAQCQRGSAAMMLCGPLFSSFVRVAGSSLCA